MNNTLKKNTQEFGMLFLKLKKNGKVLLKKYVKVYQPSTSCDAEFNSLGNYYLVYAKKENMFSFWTENISNIKLTTWLCSRTREYEGVNEPNNDLKLLDEQFPTKVKLNSFQLNFSYILYGSLLFVIGLLIGIKLKNSINKANQQAQQN